MITTTDLAPFAGGVGGGFFVGFIAGYVSFAIQDHIIKGGTFSRGAND